MLSRHEAVVSKGTAERKPRLDGAAGDRLPDHGASGLRGLVVIPACASTNLL